MNHCTAICPIGLEKVAATELHELGLRVGDVHLDAGLVEWQGSLEDVIRANLMARTVERIAVTAAEFAATNFAELRRKAGKIAWETWFDGDRNVTVRVTSKGSKLYHENGIAERIVGAIGDRLGREVGTRERAAVDDPGEDVQLLIVRVRRNVVSIRVDSSGERLHRRGYRLATAKAPLRETMAAAILKASGWTPGAALVDPFCGSGTFPIEAALMGTGHAVGADRPFAFERWPETDLDFVQQLRERTTPAIEPGVILARDRSEGAIDATRSNAERAGVLAALTLEQAPLSTLQPPTDEPGWIVTNPPYGQRTASGKDPVALYRSFGALLRERFRGWHVSMLCPDDDYARASGITWEIGPWLNNGGIRVRLLHAYGL